MESISVCQVCGARAIGEETESHKCDHGYRIERNTVWLRAKDGMWKKLVVPPAVMMRVIQRMKDEGSYSPDLATRIGRPDGWTVYNSVTVSITA